MTKRVANLQAVAFALTFNLLYGRVPQLTSGLLY